MTHPSGILIHYYFKGEQHLIDAHLRNKREAELLALYEEAAEILGVDLTVYAMPSKEGGYIEFWQFLADHNAAITSASAIVAAVSIFISHLPKSDKLKRQLTQLDIQEKELQIEKLRRELRDMEGEASQKTLDAAVDVLNGDNKAVTRRSNFYKSLSTSQDVQQLGIGRIGLEGRLVEDEVKVKRKVFPHFVLKTNRLPPLIDEDAVIELISPVLGEGGYKWKGLYQGQAISFKMADEDFQSAVLEKSVSFNHGTNIQCELIVGRKLDETGEVVITGYTVSVVMGIGDEDGVEETPQGREHKHSIAEKNAQGDIFNPYEEWGSF